MPDAYLVSEEGEFDPHPNVVGYRMPHSLVYTGPTASRDAFARAREMAALRGKPHKVYLLKEVGHVRVPIGTQPVGCTGGSSPQEGGDGS